MGRLRAYSACGLVVLVWCLGAEGHLLGFPTTSEEDAQRQDPSGFSLQFKSQPLEFQDVPLKFDAPLPKWLNGTLIRNGVGKFEMGPRKFLHIFDGYAKLSSWRFLGNGEALFSSRFLASDFHQISVASKTIAPFLLFDGVEPAFSLPEHLESLANGLDNMNVNVYRFLQDSEQSSGHGYLAISDWWKAYQFNPSDLSTVSAVNPSMSNFSQTHGIGMSSAHPLPEPGTSNYLTFLTTASFLPWQASSIALVRIRSVRRREVIAQWDVKRTPYMHSFSVTSHYAVLFACPYFYDVMRVMETMRPMEGMVWDPTQNTTVYVIRLSDGKVTTLQTEAMLAMHHVNAYEKSTGELVVDVCAYMNADAVVKFQFDIQNNPKLRNSYDPHAQLRRYHISLNQMRIQPEYIRGSTHVPYSAWFDFPTLNEVAVRSKPYCFVYGLVFKWDNKTYSNLALVKKDLCSSDGRGDRSWKMPLHYPSEAWFVANPSGSKQEDDGVLLVPVLDGKARNSYLLVLDARDMSEVARASLPALLPMTFHGRFFQWDE